MDREGDQIKTAGDEKGRAGDASLEMNLETDGVIGYALFGRFVVALDYERMVITLSEAADFNYRGQGSSLPLEFQSNFPFATCMVTLADGKTAPLTMIVDLGAAHALSLNGALRP